jgi:hypothetical protein
MGTELERRLSALENRAGIGRDLVEVIIRTFVQVSPDGPLKSEPRAIVNLGDGSRVARNAGESVEDFIDRVVATAPRVPGCITRLREELTK